MTASSKLIPGLLLLAAISGAILWLGPMLLQPREPTHALRFPEPMELPAFGLQDQDGQPLTNAWFDGHWTLVFFGFTNCPDICPATLQVLMLARAQLAADHPDGELPGILLVSVDPDRDTPAILKQYVAHFGAGVSGATGDPDELKKLAGPLGVFFQKEEPAGDNPQIYNVAHSAHVVVIDNEGRFSAVFSAPHTVDAFVDDLPLLMTAQ